MNTQFATTRRPRFYSAACPPRTNERIAYVLSARQLPVPAVALAVVATGRVRIRVTWWPERHTEDRVVEVEALHDWTVHEDRRWHEQRAASVVRRNREREIRGSR